MTDADPARPLLRIAGVKMRFGGVVALGGVSFDVGHGQICGLIGPNGSGKTTLFNCISGIYRYVEGDIQFEGRSLTNIPRHRMAGIGLGRTFQNVALFRHMSVRDNILVGAHNTAVLRLHRQRPAPAHRPRASSTTPTGACTNCWTCWTCARSPTRPSPAPSRSAGRSGWNWPRADDPAQAADAGRAGGRAQPRRGG